MFEYAITLSESGQYAVMSMLFIVAATTTFSYFESVVRHGGHTKLVSGTTLVEIVAMLAWWAFIRHASPVILGEAIARLNIHVIMGN